MPKKPKIDTADQMQQALDYSEMVVAKIAAMEMPPEPTRVYCHVGVHIYNRCETTFNVSDGYTLQEVPHGILVSCQPDSRYVGKDHKVLVTWANIHAIRYDE